MNTEDNDDGPKLGRAVYNTLVALLLFGGVMWSNHLILQELKAIRGNQTLLHMVAKTINIGECNYIATEHPFTITHRGDCTNHAANATNKLSKLP